MLRTIASILSIICLNNLSHTQKRRKGLPNTSGDLLLLANHQTQLTHIKTQSFSLVTQLLATHLLVKQQSQPSKHLSCRKQPKLS